MVDIVQNDSITNIAMRESKPYFKSQGEKSSGELIQEPDSVTVIMRDTAITDTQLLILQTENSGTMAAGIKTCSCFEAPCWSGSYVLVFTSSCINDNIVDTFTRGHKRPDNKTEAFDISTETRDSNPFLKLHGEMVSGYLIDVPDSMNAIWIHTAIRDIRYLTVHSEYSGVSSGQMTECKESSSCFEITHLNDSSKLG